MSPRDLSRSASAEKAAPWLQAGRVAFLGLYGVAVLAACAWAFSNVREIAPNNRAVVLRFGALSRVQDSGLLLAWPAPFEEVVIAPSPEHILEWQVQTKFWTPPGGGQAAEPEPGEAQEESSGADEPAAAPDYGKAAQEELDGGDLEDADDGEGTPPPGSEPPLRKLVNGDGATTGYLLTGDAGVVQLGIRFFFHVEDPFRFVLQGAHVEPALDRLAARSAIAVCAGRDLDGILVARPELVGAEGNVAEQRERLRADFVDEMNRRLAALTRAGLGIGVTVDRADIQSTLPAEATDAFDAVLTASQQAEQEVAAARNDAAKTAQNADQTADNTIQSAQAQADESIAKAKRDTASIRELAREPGNAADPNLALRLFRERIPAILAKAGSTMLVQPGDDGHLILGGTGR